MKILRNKLFNLTFTFVNTRLNEKKITALKLKTTWKRENGSNQKLSKRFVFQFPSTKIIKIRFIFLPRQ